MTTMTMTTLMPPGTPPSDGPEMAHLRVVREGRGRSPVIAVGLSEVLEDLEAGLPPEVPVWWLRLDGFDAPPAVIRPIPEIASAFAREVLRHRPGGPILLAGYSFCGLVAIELARVLRASGREVRIASLEPPPPGILPTRAKRRRGAAVKASAASAPAVPSRLARLIRGVDVDGRPFGLGRRTFGRAASAVDRHYRERWLRPRLDALIRRGADVLPERHRGWWYYLPQVRDRILAHQVLPDDGSIHLVGRPDWLDANRPTWEVLLEAGTMSVLPLPRGGDHHQILRLPGARPWIDLLAGWALDEAPGL